MCVFKMLSEDGKEILQQIRNMDEQSSREVAASLFNKIKEIPDKKERNKLFGFLDQSICVFYNEKSENKFTADRIKGE